MESYLLGGQFWQHEDQNNPKSMTAKRWKLYERMRGGKRPFRDLPYRSVPFDQPLSKEVITNEYGILDVYKRQILNGVYWLETDRCEEMLAVCYPIWKSDISIPEQNQGEQLEYDRMYGIDNTLGYLFFSKQNSVIPLHELSLFYPEIKESSVVDMDALLKDVYKRQPVSSLKR